MVAPPTILLLCDDPSVAAITAMAARAAGHVVMPARHYEAPHEALERVQAGIVVLHVRHAAADLLSFRHLALQAGAQILMFDTAAPTPPGTGPVLDVDRRSGLRLVHLGDEQHRMEAVLRAALAAL